MKEENGKSGAKKRNPLYAALALAAVLIATAIIVTSVALASRSRQQIAGNNPVNSSTDVGGSSDGNQGTNSGDDINKPNDNPGGDDKPVISTATYGFPVESANVIAEYGFYHNKAFNNYYEHRAIDFAAEEGTKVFATAAGTIESVYTSDILVGTQITVDHGNGMKSVYAYVTAKEGLKAGDKVEKGDEIATIAEANGGEYKDGAHLHFEMLKDGKNVDPATYLTLEEK